jgi:hypothetical protein
MGEDIHDFMLAVFDQTQGAPARTLADKD